MPILPKKNIFDGQPLERNLVTAAHRVYFTESKDIHG